MKPTAIGLLLLFVALSAASFIDSDEDLAITIYNNDFALVKDTRTIQFDQGISQLYFDDVASTIETTTVMFTPEDKAANVTVYEQNLENNLADKYALLKKYIGKVVSIDTSLGQTTRNYRGELLSYSPAFILRTSTGVNIFESAQVINVAALPEGMILKPTLVWQVYSEQEQRVKCQVAYRATGFSWKSDYVLTINEDEDMGQFAGWVSIDNNSGKKYVQAKLKLIAGDVNTVQPVVYRRSFAMKSMAMMDSMAAPESNTFSEKSFADYHMYTLPRRVNINESSQKQIEFIPRTDAAKLTKYYAININAGGYEEAELKATNTIKLLNSELQGLGMPLPKGTVRVFKNDTDGALEFIGEDQIQHTPKNENITLKTGHAFDITAKKTVSKRSDVSNGYDATLRLEINNRGDGKKPIDVRVELNNYYGDNLQIVQQKSLSNLLLARESANKYLLQGRIAAGKSITIEWDESYRSGK